MKLTGINPLSGAKVNVLDPGTYGQGIVGVGYLLLIVAGGLYLYKRVASAVSGTPLGPMTVLPSRAGGNPGKLRIVQGL